jgi:hypothetical protein
MSMALREPAAKTEEAEPEAMLMHVANQGVASGGFVSPAANIRMFRQPPKKRSKKFSLKYARRRKRSINGALEPRADA